MRSKIFTQGDYFYGASANTEKRSIDSLISFLFGRRTGLVCSHFTLIKPLLRKILTNSLIEFGAIIKFIFIN